MLLPTFKKFLLRINTCTLLKKEDTVTISIEQHPNTTTNQDGTFISNNPIHENPKQKVHIIKKKPETEKKRFFE